MSKKSASKFARISTASFIILLVILLFAEFPQNSTATGNNVEMLTGVVRYQETFDGVQSPQLPNGWTTNSSGAGVNFATVTNFNDSAPNSVFTPDTAATGLSELTSPPILITGARSVLNFRHKYVVENTWDGGVLEMKIGAGQFQDILTAGGTFLTGGYTSTLNTSANPLAGRFAWSGATQNNFLATSVQLPANTFGQTVQFRWRFGTNESFANDGWWIDSVTVETIPSGSNLNSIAISSSGTANPYPSEIQVAGQTGLITGVSVTLDNFSHTSPDDVDILLVAPNGRKIILMSDAGGNTAVNNLSLTFTDSAVNNLPDDSTFTSGLFKPTNFDNLDTFPSPAPQGLPSGNTFNSFYGGNPNGTWSLYVVDDNGDNAGAISGGWSLDLQNSASACLFSLDPSVQSIPVGGGSGSFNINIPAGCGWSVAAANSFISINSPANGVGNSTVSFSVLPNTGAGRTGLINITDGFNSRTFQIQQGSGCPTSIDAANLTFSASGGNGSINVNAGNNCSWQAVSNVSWIVVTSASQSGNGTATFNVLPNSARNSRTTNISIGAKIVSITQAGFGLVAFDYDGDGKADVSVFRPSLGGWYISQSSNNVFSGTTFGQTGDTIAPADFDGDGKTDISVFRNGNWYRLNSSNGTFASISFGIASDIPVPADFDGDSKADVCVFRPSTGNWYRLNSSNNQFVGTAFGAAEDKPTIGDFDGDGKADIAVFRPSTGSWYRINSSNNSFTGINFGISSDLPTPADFDGDGKTDISVYRASTGNWYRLNSTDNSLTSVVFGGATDKPVAADYDGDGKADIGVFRPSDGTWYLLKSTSGFAAQNFGQSGDIPTPNAFVR